jgi:hypothetical protein
MIIENTQKPIPDNLTICYISFLITEGDTLSSFQPS